MNSDWPILKLESIVERVCVGFVGSCNRYYTTPENGVPMIRTTNLTGININYNDMKYVSTDFHMKNVKSQLRRGDILIARHGDNGLPAIYETYEDANCLNVVIVKPKDNLNYIDNYFLLYSLKSPFVVQQIKSCVGGSVQDVVNTKVIAKLDIPFPDRLVRENIVNQLHVIDKKIEMNTKISQNLEIMARAIFKSWFVDFDPVRAKAEGRDTGLPKEIADLFPDSFEETELGEVPKGWRLTSLGELFNGDRECVITGPFGSTLHAHDYREEGVPLILVKHVVDGHILDDNLPLVGDHKLPELQRYRLLKGDIVFTRVGAVGRSAYVHDQFVGWLISGQMLRIRIPDWSVLHPRYLAQLFLEKVFTDMVDGHALGTTRPSLNTKLLQSFRFIAPCGSLTQVFADKVEAFYAYVQNNDTESRTLAELRDTLLPKLISGDLQVRIQK